MLNKLEMLFAMECEGDIPTRRGKIQKLIKLLKNKPDTNLCFEVQQECLDEAGIDFLLKEEEIALIEKEVWND